MIVQIVLELAGVLERNGVPEPSPPARGEEAAAKDVRDCMVRVRVVALRWTLAADRSDDPARRASCANARGHSRVRPRVDQHPVVDEDPPGLFEGIDHALVDHSSEGPRKDHDLERSIRQSQVLRGPVAEGDVAKASSRRLGAPAPQRRSVRIDGEHRLRAAGSPEREAAFARADVRDPAAAKVDAIRGQLDLGGRPKVAETAGEKPADVSRSARPIRGASRRFAGQPR